MDYNLDPLPVWATNDAKSPERSGLTEVKYIEGLYTLWDAILAAHPGLLIDDCSSGGRRIDVETLSRSFPLWRSDYGGAPTPSGAASLQVMSMGLTQLAPVSSGAVWGIDPYNWRSAGVVGKTISWGLTGGACGGWQSIMRNATAIAQLKLAVAETKSLREFAIDGDYFPLTPTTIALTDWAAYQFHKPQECPKPGVCMGNNGFAMFFRRHEAEQTSMSAGLLGLSPSAHYDVVTHHGFAPDGAPTTYSGEELSKLIVKLGKGKSLLLMYTPAKVPQRSSPVAAAATSPEPGAAAAANTQPPNPPATAIFSSGQDAYFNFLNPSLVRLSSGKLCVFSEARKGKGGDGDPIDVGMATSTTGGRTWSNVSAVATDGHSTLGNLVAVVVPRNGSAGQALSERVLLIFCANNSLVWQIHSDDACSSWSSPKDISSQVREPDDGWMATGPANGIVLSSGRILVPVDTNLAKGQISIDYQLVPGSVGRQRQCPMEFLHVGVRGAAPSALPALHAPGGGDKPLKNPCEALDLAALFKLQQRAFVMYSDTHGASWKRGGFLPLVASETALAELSDGSILASSRMAEMGWQNVPSKRLFSSPSPVMARC